MEISAARDYARDHFYAFGEEGRQRKHEHEAKRDLAPIEHDAIECDVAHSDPPCGLLSENLDQRFVKLRQLGDIGRRRASSRGLFAVLRVIKL